MDLTHSLDALATNRRDLVMGVVGGQGLVGQSLGGGAELGAQDQIFQ
jgi:hypothetical protein